jgi:hypothetical protein
MKKILFLISSFNAGDAEIQLVLTAKGLACVTTDAGDAATMVGNQALVVDLLAAEFISKKFTKSVEFNSIIT